MVDFFLAALHPLAGKCLRRAMRQLVRHHAIAHIHQRIAIDSRLDGIGKHRAVEIERIGLILQTMHGKNRHLRIARIFESLTQNAQVIRRPAGSAGLEQHDARMIRIAKPRLQRLDKLADNHDSRITHIVVDIAQPRVDGLLARHRRNDDIIAILADSRLEELKVNWCHLRCQDGMRRLAVRSKPRPRNRLDFLIGNRRPARERCHQRTQADAGRPEIRNLIELDHRVDAVMLLQNILDLPRRQRIEPAAKRTELDKRQIVMLRYELRRMIETRMIAPLIDHLELSSLDRQMIDRIL